MKNVSKKLLVLILTGAMMLGTVAVYAIADDPNDPPRPGIESAPAVTELI